MNPAVTVSTVQRPRLLLVLPSIEFGGAERVAFNLLQGLIGFEGVLLTQAALAVSFAATGCSMLHFEAYGCQHPYDLGVRNSGRYARGIAAASRAVQADVVLAFMHNGSFFAALAQALGGMPPLVGSIHGNISAYFLQRGRAPTPWERLIVWVATRVPAVVVVPSRGVAEDLCAHFGASLRRIKVIVNGIDQRRVRQRAEDTTGLPSKQVPWVVTACRLSDQKDFACLLRAFRRVREKSPALLWIAGEGEQRARIEQWVADWELGDAVKLLGFQENPYPWMARADVLVLSSHYEGSPVAIIEGLTLGAAQVVSDCPSGPNELIKDGVNGFLVPMGDDAVMAARMLQLLENPALQARLGEAARASSTPFALATMVATYESCLASVLAGQKHD